MGRVLDTLYEKLQRVCDNPRLILDQLFMIDILQEYQEELPPFNQYWETLFKKKQMRVISRKLHKTGQESIFTSQGSR